MNRAVLLPVAMIVLAPACSDRAAPTAPAKPPSLSLTAPDASASSTVCRAYDNERKRSNAVLAQNLANRGLQQKVDVYNRIIADACN